MFTGVVFVIGVRGGGAVLLFFVYCLFLFLCFYVVFCCCVCVLVSCCVVPAVAPDCNVCKSKLNDELHTDSSLHEVQLATLDQHHEAGRLILGTWLRPFDELQVCLYELVADPSLCHFDSLDVDLSLNNAL